MSNSFSFLLSILISGLSVSAQYFSMKLDIFLASPGAACVRLRCRPGTSFVKRQLRRLRRHGRRNWIYYQDDKNLDLQKQELHGKNIMCFPFLYYVCQFIISALPSKSDVAQVSNFLCCILHWYVVTVQHQPL